MYLILQRTTSSSNPREDFKEKNNKMSTQMNYLVMFFRLIWETDSKVGMGSAKDLFGVISVKGEGEGDKGRGRSILTLCDVGLIPVREKRKGQQKELQTEAKF